MLSTKVSCKFEVEVVAPRESGFTTFSLGRNPRRLEHAKPRAPNLEHAAVESTGGRDVTGPSRHLLGERTQEKPPSAEPEAAFRTVAGLRTAAGYMAMW
jgi:hypothetical protein